MDLLPDEILEEIFSYNSSSDLIWNISNVCVRWRIVSASCRLWKNRTFCPSREDSEEGITSALKRCHRLQAVDFGKTVVTENVLSVLADNCIDLIKVRFGFHDLSCKLLLKLQANCKKIEYLDFYCKIMTCPTQVEILGRFVNLRAIHCHYSDFYQGDMKLKAIADGCPKLECLDIADPVFALEELTYFLIQKKDTLRSMVLRCNSGGNFDECTIPLLSVCTALQSLCIYGACPGKASSLARILGNLKTLRSLTFRGIDLVSELFTVEKLFSYRNMARLGPRKFRDYTFEDYRSKKK